MPQPIACASPLARPPLHGRRGRRWSSHGRDRSLRAIVCLSAWLLATGVHWDVVQVIAWARMLTDNLRERPVAAAVARTFSTEGRCGACLAVQEAKRQQSDASSAPGFFAEKAPLVFQDGSTCIVAAPRSWSAGVSSPRIPASVKEAPPVPPPRAA